MTFGRSPQSGLVGTVALVMATLGMAGVLLASPPACAQQGDAVAPPNAAPSAAPDAEPAKPKRKPKPKPKPVKKVEKTDTKAAPPPGQPGAPAPAAAPDAPKPAGGASLVTAAGANAPPPSDIAGALKGAGIGRCADGIDAAAAPSMVGATQSNTVSTWSNTPPIDKHLADVVIGQRYGNNPVVPFGATAIVAAPTPSGACDLMVFQVVSSPLPCAAVRASLGKGKKMADVAGLVLVQDGASNTLLMPTGTNTCVLIDYKASFAP